MGRPRAPDSGASRGARRRSRCRRRGRRAPRRAATSSRVICTRPRQHAWPSGISSLSGSPSIRAPASSSRRIASRWPPWIDSISISSSIESATPRGHALVPAGDERPERTVLIGDRRLVGAALAQERGHLLLAPADRDLERGQAVLVGRVDRRAGVEQRGDRPRRPPAPDRLVQVTADRPRAVRAEHLDHLRVREVQRPPEVVVDEVLPRAGVDHEHRARRVGELARVVEDLVAVVAVALVGRVGARLEQHPRQLGVAGDPGRAVQGDLEPVAVVNERRVRIGAGGEQPAHDLADPRRPLRVAAQQPREAGVEDRLPAVRAGRLAHRGRPGRQPARDLVGLTGGARAREVVAGERGIGVEQRPRAPQVGRRGRRDQRGGARRRRRA